MRIISLVPSLTEYLADIGLRENLVGRTKFCIHPEPFISSIPKAGGTKNPRIDKIRELKPDLVIANKEENRKEDIDQIRSFSDVEVTEVDDISSALSTMQRLAERTGRTNPAEKLINQINEQLSRIPDMDPVITAYLIWRKPWMTIGRDTYIHSVMETWGLQNIYGDQTRYPETNPAEIAQNGAKLILLSSEPFPFTQKHIEELSPEVPGATIQLVNGEWFSWYGSRMVKAFTWLNTWRNELNRMI